MKEDIEVKNKEEQELLEVIRKYNNGEYPMITGMGFCLCLFGFMRLKGIDEFDVEQLEHFIQEKLNIEKFRFIFADIDASQVIQEGLLDLEVIYGGFMKAKIHYSRKQSKEFILSMNEEYRQYIEEFASEFQKVNLETKKEKIKRKVKEVHSKITGNYYFRMF